MSVNIPYVEGTSENLRRILRSHKIRSTFYSENTLRKRLCKPKNRVAAEDEKKKKLTVLTEKESYSLNLHGL